MLFPALCVSSAADTEMMPFLRLPRDPSKLAMAGAGAASLGALDAYSALGGGAFSLLRSERTFDGAAAWQSWSPEMSDYSAVAAGASFKPLDRVAFSLAFSVDNYQKIADFVPSDFTFGLGATGALGESLAASLQLRYASQKLWEDVSYNAFCADLLLQYTPLQGLSLAGGLMSLGPKVKGGDGTAYPIPSSALISCEYVGRPDQDWMARAVADVNAFFSGHLSAAAGIELGWRDSAFLRAGYRYATEGAAVPSFFSVGAGLRFYGIGLDVSYIIAEDNIGGSLSVGLGYSF